MPLRTNDRDSRPGTDAPTIVKNAGSRHFSAVDLDAGRVLAALGDGQYPHTAVFHPDLPVAYLVYIASAHVEVVDLRALETIQCVENVGTTPVGSALGPDTARFFLGTAVDLPGDADPGVLALDVDDDGTLSPADERPVGRCSGMRVGPGGRLWVGQKRAGEVVAFDPATLAVERRADVGRHPHDMYVVDDSDDATHSGLLVVNNAEQSFASIVDTADGAVLAEATTGENPHGFAVAETETYWYGLVPARDDDRVAVVDLDAAAAGAADPTEALLDLGTATGFAAVHPDGRYAVVDSYDEPFVTVLDLADLAVAGRVEVGGEPLHLAFDDAGDRCYVGNMARSSLTVLDTAPLAADRPGDVELVDRIAGLGDQPSGIFEP
jgi:hypothetical protein